MLQFISCRAQSNLQILHAAIHLMQGTVKFTNIACCNSPHAGHCQIYKYCMLSMSCFSGAQSSLQILHAVNVMHLRGTVKSTNIACCQYHAFQWAQSSLQILHVVNVMHFRGTVKSSNIACCQCHAFQGHS